MSTHVSYARALTVLLVLAFCTNHTQAQLKKLRYRESTFQLSFFPGISTNGLSGAMYYNKFSINLTSGLSAGNRYFELGVISNTHTRSSSGIQIAGLANIVGSNSYINLTNGEELQLIREGDRSDLNGIQLSGLLNFVRNNARGLQLSGGFNVNLGNASVIQLAGFSNVTGQSFGGIQVAGLSNHVMRSARGLQVSLLFNNVRWEVDGVQIAAINKATKLPGRNSVQMTANRGVQVGLVNISRIGDGLQIGLINRSGRFRGMQIGLINLYQPSPFDGSQGRGKYGVPVGLINIGSSGGHVRLYADELFLTSVEMATGNCRNCSWTESTMPISGRFQIMNQNALIFGYNHWDRIHDTFKWGAGYGFQQVLYNKASMSKGDPNNRKYFISYGLSVLHLNREEKFNGDLSLLTRAHTELGAKVKKLGFYIFSGVNLSYYLHDDEGLDYEWGVAEVNFGGSDHKLRAGYTFGVQL